MFYFKNKIRSTIHFFFNITNKKILKKNGASFGVIETEGILYVRNYGGTLSIGNNVKINSSLNSNPVGGVGRNVMVVKKNAHLIIGDNCAISNSVFMCHNEIIIGENVTIGAGCKIYDTDFHSIYQDERINTPGVGIRTAPVKIRRGAFIGASVIVLKGVTIGEGSVIGAGSVLTRDVGDFEVWAGNPACKIRTLNHG